MLFYCCAFFYFAFALVSSDPVVKDRPASGCKDDNGKDVLVGEKLRRGEVIYKCTDGGRWTASACIAPDNREIGQGETFEENRGGFSYWFTCKREETGLTIVPGGCAHGGTRFQPGDRFVADGVVLECKTDVNGGTNVEPAGCMVKDAKTGVLVERLARCYWDEGEDPRITVTYTCNVSHDKKTANPIPLHCTYKHGSSSFYIPIGCYRAFDNEVVWGCKKDPSGYISPVSLKYDKKTFTAKDPGSLRDC